MPLRRLVAVTVLTAVLASPSTSYAATGSSPSGSHPNDDASAAAGRSPGLRVVTFNVFQDLGLDQHRQDWAALKGRADVVLLQETGGFRVADVVDTRRWRVVQGEGSRGESAVVVRRSAVRSAGHPLVRRVLPAQDCNAGIGPRFLVAMRLVLRDGTRVRVASTHLPHTGCPDASYTSMITHLRSWVRKVPERLVIGADWNRSVMSDPGGLAATTRLRPHGVDVDGFQVDRHLRVRKTVRLGNDDDWLSDHEPVRVTIGT